jgi:hypothetical protein
LPSIPSSESSTKLDVSYQFVLEYLAAKVVKNWIFELVLADYFAKRLKKGNFEP